MKKSITVILSMLLLLCSCATVTDGNSRTQDSGTEIALNTDTEKSRAVSQSETETVTNIRVTHNNELRYLSELYEYPIKTAFYSGEWVEDTAECLCDFTINIDGKEFNYHSECGTLQQNGKSKTLSDSDKENVNELLFALFGLK